MASTSTSISTSTSFPPDYYIEIDMSYHFTRCILCGHRSDGESMRLLYKVKENDPVTLSGRFREYYGNDDDPEGTRTSFDKRIRWDIGSKLRIQCSDSGPVEMVMFHGTCWNYLEKCLGQGEVGDRFSPDGELGDGECKLGFDLEAIFVVFRRIARPNGLSFRSHYVDRFRLPSFEELSNRAKACPQPRVRPRYSLRRSNGVARAPAWNSTDAFRLLPLELQEYVAILLSTHDFLNLRLVSRAMTGLFHDNHFWKSRFKVDGERGFFHHLLLESIADTGPETETGTETDTKAKVEAASKPIDWRMLYHASTRLEPRTHFVIEMWEILQWVKDVLHAKRASISSSSSSPQPLGFVGRSLQCYSNDCCVPGQQVERARISPLLAKIGILIVSEPTDTEPTLPAFTQRRDRTGTRVFGLEFLNRDGSKVVLGTRDLEAKRRSAKSVRKEVEVYENDEKEYRISPFDDHGVWILVNATSASFRGFRYERVGGYIVTMGVLRDVDAHPKALPRTSGLTAWVSANEELQMKEVVEVVATFENNTLVDLGIRGRHLQGKCASHLGRFHWGAGGRG
ncbi:hypothetical protein BJX70DRAFT_372262 [Aspergillus crustosus]